MAAGPGGPCAPAGPAGPAPPAGPGGPAGPTPPTAPAGPRAPALPGGPATFQVSRRSLVRHEAPAPTTRSAPPRLAAHPRIVPADGTRPVAYAVPEMTPTVATAAITAF